MTLVNSGAGEMQPRVRTRGGGPKTAAVVLDSRLGRVADFDPRLGQRLPRYYDLGDGRQLTAAG